MLSENRPTTKELLMSWQRLWQRKLNGKPTEIKEAIEGHVRLFPKGNRSEVEARIRRTIAAYSGNPNAIRAHMVRGAALLRNL